MAAPVVISLLRYMATKPIKTLLKKGMNPKTGIRYGKRKYRTKEYPDADSPHYGAIKSQEITDMFSPKGKKSLLDWDFKQARNLPKGQTLADSKIEREFKQGLIKKTKGNITLKNLNKEFNKYMGYE
jgi:hypothetical protein|tara:strand:- start:101 stop:481 length:381 start_codon:yes stop_codon:yes gene_type:complete